MAKAKKYNKLTNLERSAQISEKLKEYRANAHKIKEDEKRDLENVSTLDGARDFWVQRNRKK